MKKMFLLILILLFVGVGIYFSQNKEKDGGFLNLQDNRHTTSGEAKSGTTFVPNPAGLAEPPKPVIESEVFQEKYRGIYGDKVDFDTALKVYQSERKTIQDTVESGSGYVYYNYSGTDNFVPMMYMCEMYAGNDNDANREITLRDNLKKSRSLIPMKDAKGNETGDYKLFNDTLDDFIDAKIGIDKFLADTLEILSRLKSSNKNVMFQFASDITSSISKNEKIDCISYIKKYFK